MSDGPVCPRCQATLPRGAARGRCPRCLVRLILEVVPNGEDVNRPEGLGEDAGLGPPAGAVEAWEDYDLIEEVGRGGMGVVYKARQRSLDGRLVALKIIRPNSLDSESARRWFRREAAEAAKLIHPHIVPIYSVGQHQGQLYYTMAFINGPSLADRVERAGPLPPREAAALIRAVAEAVQHAHDAGIIHRDLKPENILLDQEGHPYVADFGLAVRIMGEAGPTAPGVFVGTPGYAAPEQVRGELKRASDVYALGAVLYELLTGRPPFAAETAEEMLSKVLSEEPTRPRGLNKSVPRRLEKICLRCLQKEPVRRYAKARDLAVDLDRFLGYSPWRKLGIAAAVLLASAAIVALGVVIRAQTDRGTLVIRADDPHTQVLVTGVGIQVTIAGSQLNRPIALRPGDYEIELRGEGRAGGLSPSRDRVTLTRGGRAVVTIGPVPPGPGQAPVLLVIAPEHFWYPEYTIRSLLETPERRVVVASSTRGAARPYPRTDRYPQGYPDPVPVTPDIALAEARGDDYAAIVFVGGNPEHFMGDTAAARGAGRLIAEALASGRCVGAIGSAPAILAGAGVLRGKRAASQGSHHAHLKEGGAEVAGETDPVVVAGQIITARSDADNDQFAYALRQCMARRK